MILGNRMSMYKRLKLDTYLISHTKALKIEQRLKLRAKTINSGKEHRGKSLIGFDNGFW